MKKAVNIINPIAKDLRTPKYRQRIVHDSNLYTRKIKHKNKDIQLVLDINHLEDK